MQRKSKTPSRPALPDLNLCPEGAEETEAPPLEGPGAAQGPPWCVGAKRKAPSTDCACDPSPAFDTTQQCLSAPESKRGHAAYPSAPDSTALPLIFGAPTARLVERFEVRDRSLLGFGQFGSVGECADVCTGERLACKTMCKMNSSGELRDREVLAEVSAMARAAGHENVVQLRGVFEEGPHVHLVMDLCAGGDLFDEVTRRHRFSEGDAAHLFADAVRAVAHCHSRGILHRDLKPENLLLPRRLPPGVPLSAARAAAPSPLVKLADFGLAVHLGAGQQTVRGMAGSPFYMAPEVLNGEYGLSADVWSLGIILYILLCGCPPFWGETDEDVFKAILENNPDLTSSPWDGISMEAKDLVRCLLDKDCLRRPTAHNILAHSWLLQHTHALYSHRVPVGKALVQKLAMNMEMRTDEALYHISSSQAGRHWRPVCIAAGPQMAPKTPSVPVV